jgi:erythromycin esterase
VGMIPGYACARSRIRKVMKHKVANMKKTTIKVVLLTCLSILLVAKNPGYAQENIRNYVKQNTMAITSIDPDSIDYIDLHAVGDAIGDAKVVMLGEQDHGDAPAFLAKTRLIKYLHEEKGFNVLAFESDFFGLNYGWNSIQKDERTIDSFLKRNIDAIWSYCNACKQLLYEYIPFTFSKGRPLEISGLDNQMSAKYSSEKLDSLLRALKIPITLSSKYQEEILPGIKNWGLNIKDSSLNNKYLGYLSEIGEELRNKLGKDDFWLQVIANLRSEDIEFQPKSDHWKEMNTRDDQMARNLKWLNENRYRDEKIIVWAHNYHISKYAGHYPEDFLNRANSMGSIFTKNADVMSKTYIIGFTSYEGTAGRLFPPTHYRVDAPRPNSFENWLEPKLDYAFVDFKKYNQTSPQANENFYMSGATKGNWYHKNSEAQWNRIFDGVFFIRKMYPCQEIQW